MAPKLPEPWLANFLTAELGAVVEWKQQILNGIKPDPETQSRFSDDGSNFRSEVASPSSNTLVQLVEVLSSEDVVTAYISDGSWKVKARFSEEAVATFEEDSGSPITTEVSGDLIRLERFTVVSTPFGPADGFVQLHIDEIEYHTLRRTILGVSHPVEVLYDIRTLIESTKSLRIPANATRDAQKHAQNDPRPTVASPKTSKRSAAQEPQTTPIKKANRTLVSSKRKSPGPTLGKDGFEVESGVNLHGPVQAVTHDIDGSPPGPKTINPRLTELLPAKRPALPPKSLAAVEVTPQTQLPTAQLPEKALVRPPPSRTASGGSKGDHRQHPASSAVVSETPLKSASRKKAPHQDDAPIAHTPSDAVPPSGTLQSTPRGKVSATNASLFAYARRKIPHDQRKLLDNPASWLPSLPGRQFPAPNVPMALLTRWNHEAEAGAAAASTSQLCADAYHQKPASRSEALVDSDSSSEHSDGTTQDFTPSPSNNWQARQAAVPAATWVDSSVESDASLGGYSRHQSSSPHPPDGLAMPPSSALGAVIRGTAQDDNELQVAPPRPLPYRKSPKKRHGEAILPPPPKRHALPPKPTFTATGSPRHGKGSDQDFNAAGRSPRGTANVSIYPECDPVTGLPTHVSSPSLPPVQRQLSQGVRSHVSQPSTFRILSTQGKLSKMPPSGPRSTVPHTYQGTQTPRTSASKGPASSSGLATEDSGGPHDPPRSQAGSSNSLRPGSLHGSSRQVSTQSEQKPSRGNAKPVNGSSIERSTIRASSGRLRTAPSSATNASSPNASPWRPEAVSTQLNLSNGDDDTDINPAHNTKPPAVTLSIRKDWLKANYIPSSNGPFKLPNVLERYRKAFPHDSAIFIEDLLLAARYAFSKDDITHSMRYKPKRSMSTTQPANNNDSDATRSPRPGLPHSKEAEESRRLPSGSLNARGPELPRDHPGYKHRQARMQFINQERRKDYLRTNYTPSSNGTHDLDGVSERYRQAYPEDNQVTLQKLLLAARNVYGDALHFDTLTAATRYTPRLNATETAGIRLTERQTGTKKDGYELQMMAWIKDNYTPSRKGSITLATILARYRHSCPKDDHVEYEHVLVAAQAAYPTERITPGLPWMSKAEDRKTENGGQSRSSDAVNRHHAVLESTSTMAEFCAAYLAPLPSDGNAFAAGKPRRTRQIHVDVLSWDI
ncbi:hypothetical protein CKM354_000338400 [Cercospora kikuchii]|uniref:Shelterin complex subunit TPP1/Est3 domain-containing protein n=1 Tax=Cercospora kikuchii TaxID=84275 RepID=A0A9P3CBZ0_9PEZI|nr:uncharacterized protein CKM354_000338400 [Cercospora kikuchii]GIZ40028.1 hypothetical protein CKM354_000338400 [Cercospora kikuchii]